MAQTTRTNDDPDGLENNSWARLHDHGRRRVHLRFRAHMIHLNAGRGGQSRRRVVHVLMPVFAEDILRGGPRVFGYLMSATGVGALGGAIFLASRSRLEGWPR